MADCPSGDSDSPHFRRERPGRLMRFLFKLPVYLYWGPLARLMAWRCVLRVTTIGRKSGKLRKTCISFMPLDGNYVVFAGWGVIADWYRNMRANPQVRINVGSRSFMAHAHPVASPEQREALMRRMSERSGTCGPPTFIRPLLGVTQVFDYDNEIRMAVDHARDLPVIELVPLGRSPATAEQHAT